MTTVPLRRLIYRSRSTIAGDAATLARELAAILLTARTRNTANGLTGALMMRDVRFAQMLEGPSEAIDETYARIARDSRHEALEILDDGPAPHRLFADWTMAYAGDVDAPDIPLTLSLAGMLLNQEQSEALERLRGFVGAGNGAPIV